MKEESRLCMWADGSGTRETNGSILSPSGMAIDGVRSGEGLGQVSVPYRFSMMELAMHFMQADLSGRCGKSNLTGSPNGAGLNGFRWAMAWVENIRALTE